LLLNQLKSSLEDETPPETAHLLRLYEEVGVVFPQSINRRFEEVANFHKIVLENRRAHLAGEIGSSQARIKDRDFKKESLDRRRAEIMNILRSGGALEHFLLLQEESGRTESEVSTLKKKLELAEQIETTKATLGVERAQLTMALQNDLKERESATKRAVLIFEELSESLYMNERAGNLYISPSKNGVDLEIKIDGERSKGISNMQIFCFDMMLMQICHERGIGSGFLVHDSHLFDGVDERQIAKALQIGAERSKKLGFQYLVTMNSDAMPKEGFQEGFDLKEHILPVRLTDEDETGGLFGVRF
ncbi:MAG: ABC-three component system protein, partial [Alphaproteobacteria bacterium]